jgi:hypothetical protein
MRHLAGIMIFCALLVSSVKAQSVYFGVGGGFSSMSPPENYAFTFAFDLTPWPGKFEELTGRKADIGFNIVSSLEFRLPDAPVSFTAGVSYTQFHGHSDFAKANSPPWFSTIFIIGELETHSNMLSLKSGAQCEIISAPIAPYVSFDVLYNIIGDTKLSINSGNGSTKAIAEGNTRMGLSFGGGARLGLHPSLDARFGVNYSLFNLISPETNEESRGAIGANICLLYKVL